MTGIRSGLPSSENCPAVNFHSPLRVKRSVYPRKHLLLLRKEKILLICKIFMNTSYLRNLLTAGKEEKNRLVQDSQGEEKSGILYE